MKDIKKEKIFVSGFIFAVFAFMLMFFEEYPATLFNTDDWCFITDIRGAYPIWGAFNPCRVLPELLGPMATWLAMHLVYPISKDIVLSLSTMSAIFLSLSIAAYAYFAYSLIKKMFSFTTCHAILITFIYMIMHFLVLRKNNAGNQFAFCSNSLTHVYFYTLPNIFNSILVLVYILEIKKGKNRGCVLLLIYVSLLSNLFASIALPAFIAASIMVEFTERKTKNIFFKENIFEFAILIFWVIVQIFEAFGGRSASIQTETLLIDKFVEYIKKFFTMLYHNVNHIFLCFSLACIIIASVILIINKDKKHAKIFIKLAISLCITFVYVLLVAARAKSSITYFGVFYEIFFFAVLIVLLSFCYVLLHYEKLKIFLPIIMLIFAIECNTSTETFIAASSAVKTQTARKIDAYIIESVMEADENGLDMVEIAIPDFGGYDNFPLATYGGAYISRFLNKYDFITQEIYIKLTPDLELNERFNIN